MKKRLKSGRSENDAPQDFSKEVLEFTGRITELLPGATFRVKLENDHEIIAYIAGKMRMNRIRLVPGDRVKVQLTPYDLRNGRIIYRY